MIETKTTWPNQALPVEFKKIVEHSAGNDLRRRTSKFKGLK